MYISNITPGSPIGFGTIKGGLGPIISIGDLANPPKPNGVRNGPC